MELLSIAEIAAAIADERVRAVAMIVGSTEMPATEREVLHKIIEDCNALIDPEQHPELSARIDAVLTPCDDAGGCVPLRL